MPMGGVKSAVGIGTLLAEGIGDTIRVSLTDDPVEEVKVGNAILQSLGLRERGLDLVACPSCGRAEVNVLELTKKVEAAIEAEEFDVPIRVAVMGCVVNGPGEAREADVGIASGNGLGFVIRRGEAVAKVPEDELVDALAGGGANGRRREGRRPGRLSATRRRTARRPRCPSGAASAARRCGTAARPVGRGTRARAATTRRCRSTRGCAASTSHADPAGRRRRVVAPPDRDHAGERHRDRGDAGGVPLVAVAVERQGREREEPGGRLQREDRCEDGEGRDGGERRRAHGSRRSRAARRQTIASTASTADARAAPSPTSATCADAQRVGLPVGARPGARIHRTRSRRCSRRATRGCPATTAPGTAPWRRR